MNLFDNLLAGVPSRYDAKPKRPLLEHDRDDDYILRIDNTTLEKFQACSRASKFYCVDRRQLRDSPALAFGGAIHEGLAVLYREGFGAVTSAVELTMTTLREKYSPNSDEWRTPQLACETILDYVDKYRNEHIKPVIFEGAPFVEKPFSLYVGEIHVDATLPYTYADLSDKKDSTELMYINKIHILWTGRLDMAITENDDNVFVLDHKTTSIGGVQFFSDFILSQQMLGYSWALRRLMPARNILGMVVNAIIQRKPTKTGKALEFVRQTYFHQKWMQDEWVQDVMSEISRFVNCLTTGFFPKATKWCFEKYGRCPYHEACTLPPDMRETFINSDEYVNVTWSPLH